MQNTQQLILRKGEKRTAMLLISAVQERDMSWDSRRSLQTEHQAGKTTQTRVALAKNVAATQSRSY